jgi:hypothetical protein
MQPLFNTALLNKISVTATCSVLALSLSANGFAQEAKVPSVAPGETQNLAATSKAAPFEQVAPYELPDSPGAVLAQSQESAAQQDKASPQTAAPPSNPERQQQQAPDHDQAQKPQRPAGTAAAEAPKVNGVTAAQPSGVAIAPAKQRRVRTIVLKVGAMVGAGVAIGTVVALTAGTPSKPPGAH